MAKLVKCRDCGHKVSKKAKACPNCGAKSRRTTSLFTWLAFFFVLAIGFGAFLPDSQTTTSQNGSPSPGAATVKSSASVAAKANDVRLDLVQIAGMSKDDVSKAIGFPLACRQMKYGESCSFEVAETEIVFIDGKADWITVEGIDDVPFGQAALAVIGLSPRAPTSKTDYSMKWEPYGSFRSISLFKGGDRSDYFYIKVMTE